MDDITRFTLIASAAAVVQAAMAVLVWWQTRQTRFATEELANVETTRFAMNFAGTVLAAAEALRQQALEFGLNQEALELERRVTDFLEVGTRQPADEDTVNETVQAMAQENVRVLKRIRDFQHANRNALGERGGATP